jgi:hypothetical protein
MLSQSLAHYHPQFLAHHYHSQQCPSHQKHLPHLLENLLALHLH